MRCLSDVARCGEMHGSPHFGTGGLHASQPRLVLGGTFPPTTPARGISVIIRKTMNNQQFRRLLLSDTPRQDGDKGKPPVAGTPKSVLGARKHSSIPMTP